jgi:hypothetical protein
MRDVTNNEIVTKTCSRCDETKPEALFILRRNICRQCNQARRKEINTIACAAPPMLKTCSDCSAEKMSTEFVSNRNRCNECNNISRRTKYKNDPDLRKACIIGATAFKQKKATIKRNEKCKEQERIGEDNVTCRYCKEIKHKDRYRHNRLKCKDCERDDPLEKFKRKIRSHIWTVLKRHHTFKTNHTREYLGCEVDEYLKWLSYCKPDYTMESKGTVWHIDHVIPLSRFDMTDPEQCLIAFNWRNTTPLLCCENLKKSNKILQTNISEHVERLNKYHELTNTIIPNEFNNLYATYLVAGNPLEPLTTTL